MPTSMPGLPPPQHRAQPHAYYPAPVAFAAIPMMPAPPPPKRPLEVVEDEPSSSKAKKSRTKSKQASETSCSYLLFFIPRFNPNQASPFTASSSRRGYNAKKRSEAAQIAAQNGWALARRCWPLAHHSYTPQHWSLCCPLPTCQSKIRAKIRRRMVLASLIFCLFVVERVTNVYSTSSRNLSRCRIPISPRAPVCALHVQSISL